MTSETVPKIIRNPTSPKTNLSSFRLPISCVLSGGPALDALAPAQSKHSFSFPICSRTSCCYLSLKKISTDPSPNHYFYIPGACQRGKGTRKGSQKGPWERDRRRHFFLSKLHIFSQPWADLGPQEPQGSVFKACLINVG